MARKKDNSPSTKENDGHLFDSEETWPERTNEDKLEFGNLDEEDEDAAFSRLMDEFMNDRDISDPKASGFEFRCEVNESPAQLPVEGLVEKIEPEEGMYVHVDLVIDELEQPEMLNVQVLTLRGSKTSNTFFSPLDVQLFHDGSHLHAKTVLLASLFDDDYTLGKGEEDALILNLYQGEKGILSHQIPIKGPWPVEKRSSQVEKMLRYAETPEELLAVVQKLPGWTHFKQRLEENVTRFHVGSLRRKAGLPSNAPSLHTVFTGGPGTGKSLAVGFLAKLYKMMGYLDNDTVETIHLSDISGSHIGEEYDRTIAVVKKAQGGVLVLDNAPDLYRTEHRNYDTEGNIVRALCDVLDNTAEYPRWMLVLTGEPDGMDLLLSKYRLLKKHFSAPIRMEDFTPEELSQIVTAYAAEGKIKLNEEAGNKLQAYILYQYNHRGPGFQNVHLVQRLFDDNIIPAMYTRIGRLKDPTKEQLVTILAEDVPAVSVAPEVGLEELDDLIGLGNLKTKVKDYLNAVRLAGRRMELGLTTNMPRLHMAFLGNPGTGKTTVAEIIGKVFASWGILTEGRVIKTEKSELVGQFEGHTEQRMRDVLARARGNVLFIDEAYQLVETNDGADFGRIVMNSLLTELGKDHQDMVVILAGYTAPMKKLLESNEGIESRFPNVFNFEDYTTDELLEIGKLMVKKQGFILTDGALANMRTIIAQEAEKPSPRFGNGRFVQNLLQNEILSTLGARTAAIPHPTAEQLSTILPEDVVIDKAQKDVVFDEVAIDEALARLDAMAGLEGVKKAIHNFVQSARYLHSIGEPYVGKGLLSWRFIGKSGTGKSTVAEILAAILKGMHLIANSHITEIRGERIFNVSEMDCVGVLREAVKKSCNGLIFIDADAPEFQSYSYGNRREIELIRLKLKEMTVESGGECALVLAEVDAPFQNVVEQMVESGVFEFDHTLVFEDFTPEELYQVLCSCLAKFQVSFTPAAESHMLKFLTEMREYADARTMKLMARTIYQQVILRESGLQRKPATHQVQLADIASFKWNGRKGKIGY